MDLASYVRPFLILAVALALGAIAPSALAQTVDEQTEFKKGRYAYAAKAYDDADALFRAMLDPKTGVLHDKSLVNEARMYWGATLIAEGKKEDAIVEFEAILSSDSKYEPDPTAFPLEVGKVFFDAQGRYKKRLIEEEERAKLLEKQRREAAGAAATAQVERMRILEGLATEEHVIDHHSRWRALLPFGLGQFQNGKPGLGVFFLSAESLLLVGGAVTVPVYLAQLENVSSTLAMGPQTSPIAQQYLDRANEARIANLIFYGALAATALAGIVEAEISYVPDLEVVTPRKLPNLPGVSPEAKPAAAGVRFEWNLAAAPVFGGEGQQGIKGGIVGIGGRF